MRRISNERRPAGAIVVKHPARKSCGWKNVGWMRALVAEGNDRVLGTARPPAAAVAAHEMIDSSAVAAAAGVVVGRNRD